MQFYIVFGHVFYSMYGLYSIAIRWLHFIVLHISCMFYLAYACTRQELTKIKNVNQSLLSYNKSAKALVSEALLSARAYAQVVR